MSSATFLELQRRRKEVSSQILKMAAIYNVVWGGLVILFPNLFFDLFEMPRPTYPEIWQCVGMIVGVYGVGYYLAASDPARHWPVVLVGLLGKIFGPIGFLQQVILGKWPLSSGLLIVTNDLLWWIPFIYILYFARVESYRTLSKEGRHEGDQLRHLKEMSCEQPLLIVFLRHFGCTFCRETLKDLEQVWRDKGVRAHYRLVVVHMASQERGQEFLERYGVRDALLISDPDCRVYDFFHIPRGSLWQMFGIRSFFRGLSALVRGQHGIGHLEGEGFQMPGMVIYSEGRIQKEYQFRFAGERPDYALFLRTV